MDTIKRWTLSSGSCAAQTEDLLSFYEGRDVETLGRRVIDMEGRVDELNNLVSNSCANFDQVKAYMEQNVSQMKEFMADIVKKLPQPCRFTVQGTLRKSILLHFKCAHEHDGVCKFPSCEGKEFVSVVILSEHPSTLSCSN